MTSYASHESSLTTGASPSAKVERAPVLSLKLNNISKTGDKADMAEDLCSMWSVFHQCSKSGALHEGERLANLTWRLWSRETACKHVEEDAVFQDDDSDGVLAVLPGVETQQPPSDPEDDPWEPDSSEDEAVNTRRSTTDTSFSTKAKAPLSMPASPLPARSFQSSTSAPTRPPLHQTISFQKRKKTRSGSFQTAHRSLTPVELQELLSTILPMRVPNACPSSSTNAAVDFTTPIPTTLPLPVATGQHSTSSQPDPSNSSIETQCSDQGFARMALSNSDTSIELPLSSGLDRTPRPPLKKLTEESEEENADHTPANPMALSQVSQHPPRQPAALKTSDAPVLAEQQNRSDVPLKRAGSSSLAVMHRVHGRHSAGKRPALHKKKNSSKISLSRNASSKNVRIIEDTVIDSSGVIVTSSNSSSSNAKARSRSRSPGKPHNSYTMSRTSSTSNASGLVKDRKRLSSSSLAQSPTRTKPIDMQMRRVSTQNASDSAGPASSEPRSVVRGFNTSGSPESPVMPRAPFCSPAQGPPPKCNLASGPPTPPEAQVTLSPIPPPPSPKKPMAGRKNKFFLGTQSCSDSDEMAKSPELHLAVTQPFPHNSSLQEQPRSGSSHSHHGPSSLKNEQHFSHMTATTDKTAEMEAEVEDADDSSGWGSDYTSDSEERPPVTKGKDQATKGTKSAVKQPEKVHEPMFKRVPTAPGQLNRLESRTGLLTQLFKPSAEDVRAVDTILRQHRSAVNLPRNYSTGGLANPSAHPQSRNRKSSSSPHKALQSSKSTVALPVMSYERGNAFSDIESPQVLPHDMRSVQKESSPTRRKPSAQQIPAFAGRRLGGKPADVELSDDSDDEENKLLPAAQPIPEMAYTPTKQAALAAAVQRHQAQKRLRDQGGAQPQLMPTTPRTTRRSMLSTEMSESVRRNLLWERQSRIRLLGGPLPDRQPHGNLQTSNSSSQVPHQSVLGNSSKGQKAELKPKTWQFSGGFHEHGW